MAFVGYCFGEGFGVLKNEKQAFEWYLKAAIQGDAESQFNCAVSYRLGKGVAKDEELAVKFFEKAAIQGHANANFNLGICYINVSFKL